MNTFRARGLHGQLVNELGAQIMRGDLEPGTTIDPDQVANDFDVSRTVVREALRALTAKGLVGARPRFGTYVTERNRWHLLDADVMTWRAGDDPDPRLVTELDEVRLVIEPAAARMAAERRSEGQLARIERAWEQLEKSYRGDQPDRPDHADADLEFHRSILTAAGNELLEQFEVVLAPALHARDRLAQRHITTLAFLDAHRAVYDAIAAGDGHAAQACMHSLMELSASDTASALSRSANTNATNTGSRGA
ncbi:DNA-binding FadR family transcriptional regulator [Microbacterium sp. AK009]|uniref:FadR/GntR family transcriptional regulator n=1 Tax=Microbacterium sp. AK009 TaxID=2723068 RepID=UPI0015CBCEE1|nr:FadR/GntR family transcriptional regulator [Microbacterium sp. AK009]NYF16540.1 DNA-binding FadR family transcriptional regulator [Microbacterium sp. AK009]